MSTSEKDIIQSRLVSLFFDNGAAFTDPLEARVTIDVPFRVREIRFVSSSTFFTSTSRPDTPFLVFSDLTGTFGGAITAEHDQELLGGVRHRTDPRSMLDIGNTYRFRLYGLGLGELAATPPVRYTGFVTLLIEFRSY